MPLPKGTEASLPWLRSWRCTANEQPFHLEFSLQNAVTGEELVEFITHLAFYIGWPNANTAVGIARKVFGEAP